MRENRDQRNSNQRKVIYMYRNIQSQLVSRRLKRFSSGQDVMLNKERHSNLKTPIDTPLITPNQFKNENSTDWYNFIRTGSRLK